MISPTVHSTPSLGSQCMGDITHTLRPQTGVSVYRRYHPYSETTRQGARPHCLGSQCMGDISYSTLAPCLGSQCTVGDISYSTLRPPVRGLSVWVISPTVHSHTPLTGVSVYCRRYHPYTETPVRGLSVWVISPTVHSLRPLSVVSVYG